MSKVVYGGRDYVEYDRRVRQCGLVLFSGYDDDDNPIYLEICYTDDTECILGRDYTESHRKAVEEFAEDYDLTIAGRKSPAPMKGGNHEGKGFEKLL